MARRYKRDTTADVLEALGLIAATATNVHAANVAAKMATLEMDMSRKERALDRQSILIENQLVRAEKKYDTIYGELEASKEDFSELTGQLYKTPDKDRSENAVGVVNDIGEPILNSLSQLLDETKTETQDLMTQRTDINQQLRQASLIQDFYTGVGHDYSAGDPSIWDIEDFSNERLVEYMSQYPELADVDQEAFYEGMKTRGAANLLQNMATLNTVINQAKTSKLNADIKQLDFDLADENKTSKQIRADISVIDEGVHSMLQSQANVLNNNFLAPALQAITEFATSQDASNPEGDPELEKTRTDALELVGSEITGYPVNTQDEFMKSENERLGRILVLGNQNYVNSIKGHLAGTGDLDYVGYVNALQEIQFHGENAKRQLDDNQITYDQYLETKNRLEEIVGTNLNDFSSDMDFIMQGADRVKDKGKTLALQGMKDQYEVYTPSVDYDVPKDYISLKAAEEAATQKAMSNIILPDSTIIFPDSSTILPDTSTILIDEGEDFSLERFFGGDEQAPPSRGVQMDPKYAGLLSKGEPYFDPESGKWRYQEPMFKLAGGFLPVPNPYAFRDRPVAGQYMHEDDKIKPILDKEGNTIGFIPPTNYAPPSATMTGSTGKAIKTPVFFETLTEEQIELVLKQFEEQRKQ